MNPPSGILGIWLVRVKFVNSVALEIHYLGQAGGLKFGFNADLIEVLAMTSGLTTFLGLKLSIWIRGHQIIDHSRFVSLLKRRM